ncbi:MAG: hypothetical protein PHR53_04200 [Bacteroidales bacterium]|nr:hypothetical protein [Bacteroidales bacterium]
MKYLQKITMAAAIILLPTMLFGQYVEDVLRPSNLMYKGTARFTGMSGAFGALGGDFTTLSINPAGIGMYNKTEFVLSPSLYNTKSESEFFGTTAEEHQTHFNLNNVGMVIPFNVSDPTVKTLHFGIGFNRLQDFYNRSYIDGFNNQSSFLTGLAGEANTYGIDVFNPIYPEDLAASTLLIFSNNNLWTNDNPNGNVQQSGYLETRGAINEMVISFGGNIHDKLYFGITAGIPFYYYRRNYDYSETDVLNIADTTNPFQSMIYSEYLSTNGTGINGKFGLIYKPIDWLRIGAAIHTPTYYWNIRESWNYAMSSYFDDDILDPYSNDSMYVNHISDATPDGYNSYEVTTGMRVIGSVAATIGRYGLVDVDYEWADQKSSRISPSSSYKDLNNAIRSDLRSQHIVRAGTEWKYQNFFLRGGYAWYSNPYKETVNNTSMHAWSLGCGVRIQNFGIDFAYQHLAGKSDYYLYNLTTANAAANMKNRANSYVLTLSLRY